MNKVREGYKITEIGDIPIEWEVRYLEDVCEILDSYRKPIKASDREEMKGDIPYYGASGVIDWINDFIFDEELILLGEDGENLNSRNTDLAFKISGKSWVNNHAHVFRIANKNRDNIDFMVYYLESKDYSRYIAGSAQPKITQAQCRKFLLPSPDLKEQEKIASILSTVDEQIDNVDALIEKNKELKKGLMQTLLTKGIGHTKFKKTEIGEIPEEWEVINAGRVFNIITDYVANGSFASLAENVKYKESEDFAIVVRLTDYKNEYKGPFVYVDKNAYDFLSKSKLEDNDIIIANVGAYAGYVFRAPNINKPITLGPNAILVRSEQNREFIYYLLSSEFGQKAIKDIISTTAQPKFNKTDFKKILLPIPDLKEQYKIASILLEIDEKTEEYEKKKQKLEELKKGLMQQLLTGRIRV